MTTFTNRRMNASVNKLYTLQSRVIKYAAKKVRGRRVSSSKHPEFFAVMISDPTARSQIYLVITFDFYHIENPTIKVEIKIADTARYWHIHLGTSIFEGTVSQESILLLSLYNRSQKLIDYALSFYNKKANNFICNRHNEFIHDGDKEPAFEFQIAKVMLNKLNKVCNNTYCIISKVAYIEKTDHELYLYSLSGYRPKLARCVIDISISNSDLLLKFGISNNTNNYVEFVDYMIVNLCDAKNNVDKETDKMAIIASRIMHLSVGKRQNRLTQLIKNKIELTDLYYKNLTTD